MTSQNRRPTMSANQTKYPQLRFKGFTDPWEERKLGEISRMYQPLTITGNDLLPDGVPVFGANGFIGFFSEANHIDDQVTISARGERTGTPSYVHGPVWITGNSMVVNVGDFDIDKYFLFANLTANSLKKYVTGGAQPQLTRDVLVKVPITLPNTDEQKKIGAFFKQLDDTITLHQRKLAKLKELKQGYLQKLFPKNGSKFPQLRFAGFADAWEQRKFKDILKTHSFRSYLAGVSENGDYEVIQQGDKPIVGYSDGEPFTDYKDVTLFGDHTVSLYKPKSPFFVATDGVKILSADNFEGDYLYTTLERYKPEPQGYKRHFTILKNQDVWFTENMEEQQKIGVFFKQLDDTITLHQRKLEKLQELKKGYLQKMFC